MLIPKICPTCKVRFGAPCSICAALLVQPPRLISPAGLEQCVALCSYEGIGRELIIKLKYGNGRSSAEWLAVQLTNVVKQVLIDWSSIDAVTWIPTSRMRRRQRGFDQGRLLARKVARQLGKPCISLLTRLNGPAQTTRTVSERRLGPPVKLRREMQVPNRLLLIDDVITSGSTMSTAAALLRSSGAQRIDGGAVAWTPPRR